MTAVYLDNSATTCVSQAAAEKACEIMTAVYGNPSSLHTMGYLAERELETARKAIGRLLGAEPERLFFTSGGTEANNLAVLGSVAAHPHAGRHVVTTAMEHSSVSAACDALEKQGYTVTRLVPDKDGTITVQQIVDACRTDTALVAVMLVNNETGARFPLEKAVPQIRQRSPQAHIHCDAVQAAGKIPLQATRWGFDSLSASAHKLHGPKGCGVLYLRKGARVLPRNIGGKQEGGIRCGTEAVPLIAAFGVAACQVPDYAQQRAHFVRLRDRLTAGLGTLPSVRFHLPREGEPYIIHFSVLGIRSETMLHFLSEKGIYVSSGSACHKGADSPVLTALGLPSEEIDSAVRVSLDRHNSEEDIDCLIEGITEATETLAKRHMGKGRA